MKIIVRTVGERTRDECIRRARLEGDVDVIEGITPFHEVLRATYETGVRYDQDWVPVVDGDVLLKDGVIAQAVHELRYMGNVFCLDGRTKDKILHTVRRAGIHIYNRRMLEQALEYVKDSIKPETRAREAMANNHNAYTHVGAIVFGYHDYEQYYRDLYRKAYLQTRKLRTKLPRFMKRWPQLALRDDDYKVIIAANRVAWNRECEVAFDASIYYDADDAIARLGLEEKGPYEAIHV